MTGGASIVPGGAAPCPAEPGRADGVLATSDRTRLALIGDYGSSGPNEAAVARLVQAWSPDVVITSGDNNYPSGEADTIDSNIGQYYHQFISPYLGHYGCSARTNRFFPALGNHDLYTDAGKAYRDYFTLPGNERYYDVVIGDVHLFAVDSDPTEPDGTTATSVQAAWLQQRLAASTATWNMVYMHHPPYSSGPHLSTTDMQWPFKQWGADLVLAGHDHDYERLEIDGLPYLVNGLGGTSLYTVGPPIAGSQAHFDTEYGALLIEAGPTALTSRFFTVQGQLIDQLVLNAAP